VTHEEVEAWLRETGDRLETLWKLADETRAENVGTEVHLRGLVEFSNYCARKCGYCGLSADNRDVHRYRMSKDEIVQCAVVAKDYGYGTVVLQSGEDRGYSADEISKIVRAIKTETGLAVTLSLGERGDEELEAWKVAGADRYLMRFETSNPALYKMIHPDLPGKVSDRFAILRRLRELGYEVGSGAMIGIPGQTYGDLARDILKFAELDLDMIGVGPYLPHPDTSLGQIFKQTDYGNPDQVPNSELMTYKVVALTRLVCPKANIPSTTALATVNRIKGREYGLMRGANVVMPNVTPIEYRKEYQIYPGKACLMEDAAACHDCMRYRIESIGRTIGKGQGASRNLVSRREVGKD
jgi:biotin synthase